MTRTFCRLLILLLPLAGCAVHIPQPSPYTALQVPAGALAEAGLLDIGISQFTYEPPQLDSGRPDLQVADIRKAESRYMPVMLRHALTQTQAWGAVHVLPQADQSHAVSVEGEILEAEAHTLRLRVRVVDATGAEWFERVYTEKVGEAVYGDDAIGINDPFDGLYNRIANDMLMYKQGLDSVAGIQQVAELKFGSEFAPELYGAYFTTDRRGRSSVLRMPPASEPMVRRLSEIHQRNGAFQEVLQQRYVDFSKEISGNYFEYRRQQYRELRALQQQQKAARNDMVTGAVLLGIGVATADLDNTLGAVASAGAIVAGAVKLVGGARDYTTETPFLDELAESFSGDVVTQTVELDEEVITLSGSTEEIYTQWKDILREMFQLDRGL